MSNQNANGKQALSDEMIDLLKQDFMKGLAPAPSKRSTRFQKGQSGNPRGRPRKPPAPRHIAGETRELTLGEGKRRIRVRRGNKVTDIPVLKALIEAQTNTALQGNAYAQRDAIARHERAQREEAAEIARQHEYWTARRDHDLKILAEAKADGRPEPRLFPHPLDIVIEPGKHVRFEGPVDEDEARETEELIKLRDALILQGVVNRRCGVVREKGIDESRAAGSDFLMLMIDATLPKRLRIEDTDWLCRMIGAEAMPKRALLKATYAAWRATGLSVPRGAVFPYPKFAGDIVRSFQTMRRTKV